MHRSTCIYVTKFHDGLLSTIQPIGYVHFYIFMSGYRTIKSMFFFLMCEIAINQSQTLTTLSWSSVFQAKKSGHTPDDYEGSFGEQ